MSKKTGSDSEWKRLKKFEQENDKLRKEVLKLRKQAKTAFIDSLEERSNKTEDGHPVIVLTCENCGNHDVSIIDIERKDGNFEIKVCKSCDHKTHMKMKKEKKKKEKF